MAKRKKTTQKTRSLFADQVINRLIGLGEMVGAITAMYVVALIMRASGAAFAAVFIPFAILLFVGWLELLVGVRIHHQAAAYEQAGPVWKLCLSLLYVISTLGALIGGLALMNTYHLW